jgi:hypothetical protein
MFAIGEGPADRSSKIRRNRWQMLEEAGVSKIALSETMKDVKTILTEEHKRQDAQIQPQQVRLLVPWSLVRREDGDQLGVDGLGVGRVAADTHNDGLIQCRSNL